MTNNTSLFEVLYSGLTEGYLNIWCKRGRGSTSAWFNLADGDKVLKQAQAEARKRDAQGYDCYYSVCLGDKAKKEYERFSKDDVQACTALFADVDTLSDASKVEKNKVLPATADVALDELRKLPYPPTIAVSSGHGLHAYWCLAEVLRVGDALTMQELDAVLKRFAAAVKAVTGWSDMDAHASECSRVLRVPGTSNHKESVPLPVQVIENTGARYDVSVLDAWSQSVCPSVQEASASRPRRPGARRSRSATEDDGALGSDDVLGSGDSALLLGKDDYAQGGRYYLSDEQVWGRIAKRLKVDGAAGEDVASVLLKKFGDDASAADMSLLNLLAYYTGGDEMRMDELFRGSGLFRDKWDERHSGDGRTYGELSITEAIAGCKGRFYVGGDYTAHANTGARLEEIHALRDDYEASSKGEYSLFAGGVVHVSKKGDALLRSPLCNFMPRVTALVTQDDGLERNTDYELSGYDHNGDQLPVIRVPAKEFPTFNWMRSGEGGWRFCVVRAGNGKKDCLREAIELTIERTAAAYTTYTHTGWRLVNGKWVYLHGGGAVGAKDVHVDLSRGLSRYELPTEEIMSTPGAVQEALKLVGVAPIRIMVPLLSQVFLGVLNEWLSQAGCIPAHVLTLAGPTGAGKSTLAALAQSFYGASFDAGSLPCSFMSTTNALLDKAFSAKDSLLTCDDFHPSAEGRGVGSVDSQTASFQALCRAAGDHVARDRMLPGGGVRPGHPCRGVLLVTAEYLPGLGESGSARLWTVSVERDDTDFTLVTAAQELARKGVYAQALCGFIKWIQAKVNGDDKGEAWVASLGESFRSWRASLWAEDVHGRISSAGASLLVGWTQFLNYALDVDAITEDDHADGVTFAVDVIKQGIADQGKAVHAVDPVRLFGGVLLELLPDSDRFIRAGEEFDSEAVAGRDTLGYVVRDSVGEVVKAYIKPTATAAAVNALLRQSDPGGSVLPRLEVWKRLFRLGLSESPTGKCMHIPGAREDRVIAINVPMLRRFVESEGGAGDE